MNIARLVVVGATVAGLASACGSSGGGGTSSAPAPDVGRGKKVFVQNCGSCHTLADAGTKGFVGGPLDGTNLKAAAVEERVRKGTGGMPAFKDALSAHDIASVAAYVAKASQR